MVGYAFETRKGPVRYSVGNPMGAYSSWATFALAHHFILYRIARELGREWTTLPYVLLGDDILIGDGQVGARYLELISQLGVEYSPTKSYISSEVCEFAKRYVRHGEEVSPFPVSSISENLTDVNLWVSSLIGEARKGYVPSLGIPGAVGSLVRGAMQASEARVKRIEDEAHRCLVATQYLSGGLTSSDFVAAICGSTSREWGTSDCDYFLKIVLVETFKRSLLSDEGGMAVLSDRLLTRVWDETDHFPHWGYLKEAVPFWGAVAVIDEITLRMESSLVNQPDWGDDEWKDLIRVMFNPGAIQPLSVSPAGRKAMVGGRLGLLARELSADPHRLAATMAGQVKYPFRENNLLLVEEVMGYVFSRRIPREGGVPGVDEAEW